MSDWINDRFPDDMQSVIVACVAQWGTDVFDDHYYRSKTCEFFKNGNHSATVGVTHWMPLPEPPK